MPLCGNLQQQAALNIAYTACNNHQMWPAASGNQCCHTVEIKRVCTPHLLAAFHQTITSIADAVEDVPSAISTLALACLACYSLTYLTVAQVLLVKHGNTACTSMQLAVCCLQCSVSCVHADHDMHCSLLCMQLAALISSTAHHASHNSFWQLKQNSISKCTCPTCRLQHNSVSEIPPLPPEGRSPQLK